MAPANSPGRKKRDRDNQFFEVGVQGRSVRLHTRFFTGA